MPHAICLQDLEFQTITKKLVSSGGGAWCPTLERIGVPKIPVNVLNAVFYLYESYDDAKAGRNPGGTGFIVGWNKGPRTAPYHYYAVTNWHVAVDASDPDSPPCPVIRLNTKNNQTEIINLKPKDWHYIPQGPDIAVVPIEIDSTILKWSYVPTDMFAEVDDIQSGRVGIGDDVFMAGLFIDHDGEAVNVPSSRFGNVSVLPTPFSKIAQLTGFEAPAYILDMHSRSGFSGSPVFLYRTPGQDLTTPIYRQFTVDISRPPMSRRPLDSHDIRIFGETIFLFLGIHFGQFAEEWETGERKPGAAWESKKRGLIQEGPFVKGWSGMTTVMPAWYITHVLEEIPEIIKMREKKEAEVARRPRPKRPDPEKTKKQKDNTSNPNHLDDFKRLVDVAARKRPQDDPT
jgi:hypothetical protein